MVSYHEVCEDVPEDPAFKALQQLAQSSVMTRWPARIFPPRRPLEVFPNGALHLVPEILELMVAPAYVWAKHASNVEHDCTPPNHVYWQHRSPMPRN